jgi:ABC-type transporter Mla subunit MlaD
MVGPRQASMFDSTVNSLIGPNSAFYTVTTDPRLTPQSEAENWMDLLFLPTTVTQLNQGIQTTNQVIGQTNSIMTGLNGTIGRTNTIMTGLGTTLSATNQALAPLPGALADATSAMGQLNHNIGQGSPIVNGMAGLQNDVAPNSALNTNLGQTNKNLGEINADVECALRGNPRSNRPRGTDG